VVGCTRKGAPSTTTVVIDSTRVEVKYRDVPVPVPGETVTITEYIECDSTTNKPKPKKFEARGEKAVVTGSIDEQGKLNVTGGCDSLTAIVKAQDSLIFRLKHEKKTIVEVQYLTRGIDKFCRWFTGIVLLLTTGYIILKLKR
jgi:hypothetical protein